jgi:AcrR family transcriptional regulator
MPKGNRVAPNLRRDRIKEQQRQDILSTAREVFMQEGHAGFSMRKLAQAVGCVPGTLYTYFKDRDHILSLLIEESFEHLMVDIEAQMTDGAPLQNLRAIMTTYVQFGLDHPDHYQFAFMLKRTPAMDEFRPVPHRSFELLRKTIAACMARGILRRADDQLVAQGVWTCIHGVTSLMITMPNFPWADRQRVIEHVLDTTIRGLLPDNPSRAENQGAFREDR